MGRSSIYLIHRSRSPAGQREGSEISAKQGKLQGRGGLGALKKIIPCSGLARPYTFPSKCSTSFPCPRLAATEPGPPFTFHHPLPFRDSLHLQLSQSCPSPRVSPSTTIIFTPSTPCAWDQPPSSHPLLPPLPFQSCLAQKCLPTPLPAPVPPTPVWCLSSFHQGQGTCLSSHRRAPRTSVGRRTKSIISS